MQQTSAKDLCLKCVNHSDGHSPLMVTWVWWCDTRDKKHKYFTMSLVTRAISSRVSLPARNRPDHLFTPRARHMFSVHMTRAHCSLVTMCFMSRRFPVVFLKSKFVVYLFFLTISWSPLSPTQSDSQRSRASHFTDHRHLEAEAFIFSSYSQKLHVESS